MVLPPSIARKRVLSSPRPLGHDWVYSVDPSASYTASLPAPTVDDASPVPESVPRQRRTSVAGGACAGSLSLRERLFPSGLSRSLHSSRDARVFSHPATQKCRAGLPWEVGGSRLRSRIPPRGRHLASVLTSGPCGA